MGATFPPFMGEGFVWALAHLVAVESISIPPVKPKFDEKITVVLFSEIC